MRWRAAASRRPRARCTRPPWTRSSPPAAHLCSGAPVPHPEPPCSWAVGARGHASISLTLGVPGTTSNCFPASGDGAGLVALCCGAEDRSAVLCNLRQPFTDGHLLGVRRHSSSGAWVSAGDPEATDLSGASAKSGAGATATTTTAPRARRCARCPRARCRRWPTLEHADALLNARPENGAPVVITLGSRAQGGSTPTRCSTRGPTPVHRPGVLVVITLGFRVQGPFRGWSVPTRCSTRGPTPARRAGAGCNECGCGG